MWKTYTIKALLFIVTFAFSWLVISAVLPICLTLSPTVGIVLFESVSQQSFVSGLSAGLLGLCASYIPDMIKEGRYAEKAAD